MSKEAVEAVIGKAVLDSDFRQALFANPGEVLAGYELTAEEVAALKSVDAEAIESFAGALDERISKVLVLGPAVGRRSSGLVRWLDPEVSEGLPREGPTWEELTWPIVQA
jgi:hypothetical protein